MSKLCVLASAGKHWQQSERKQHTRKQCCSGECKPAVQCLCQGKYLMLSYLVKQQEDANSNWVSLSADFLVLCFCWPGGGTGTAGLPPPKLWPCTLNRKRPRNGCNTRLCRPASRFGLLRNTEALRGTGKTDWHHFPSSFSHELPGVQRALLAHLQSSTTRGCSGHQVKTRAVWGITKILCSLHWNIYRVRGLSAEAAQDEIWLHVQSCWEAPWHGRICWFLLNFYYFQRNALWLALVLSGLHVCMCANGNCQPTFQDICKIPGASFICGHQDLSCWLTYLNRYIHLRVILSFNSDDLRWVRIPSDRKCIN